MSVRVLVIDNSMLYRTKIQICLGRDPELTVFSCAPDEKDTIKLLDENTPDVLVLDVEVPGISGIDFMKQLLQHRRIPTIALSVMPKKALNAMSAGAVDFVCKPQYASQEAQDRFMEELITTIKNVSANGKAAQAAVSGAAPRISHTLAPLGFGSNTIVAIGASTGGTEAVIEVVKDLPADFPGIIIVQHMPANFTTMYAERLSRVCHMEAKEAEDLDRVETGKIILAAGEYHLTLKKDARGYYIRSRRGEKVSGHCPSVDVMFDSVAETAGANAIGVILTGMGADGARGITKLHATGAYTIGQDKESCVVYGMPMQAYKLGGISRQLPLGQIGDELVQYLRTHKK